MAMVVLGIEAESSVEVRVLLTTEPCFLSLSFDLCYDLVAFHPGAQEVRQTKCFTEWVVTDYWCFSSYSWLFEHFYK